jgi:hypothetical protein
MNTFKLSFSSDKDFKLAISIDSNSVEYAINDNNIILSADIPNGFHMLEIALVNPSTNVNVRINAAELDGVDFKQTLYTMFKKEGKNKHQTTVLTSNDRVLYLPFINPISAWIASCSEKIPDALYAGGLYENLAVFYPESITVPSTYPKLVQDFFSTNLDFHTHPAELLNDAYYNQQVPYADLIGKIQYDEDQLYAELMSELEYLKSTARIPFEHEYNGHWLANDLIFSAPDEYSLDTKFNIDKTRVPTLYKLFKELDLDVIVHAFLGILGPNEFIAPHSDNYVSYPEIIKHFGGCSQIYIPIKFKQGNYFKLNNVGLLPLDRPILINNHNFCHALVNNSSDYRFGIGIVGSRLKNV